VKNTAAVTSGPGVLLARDPTQADKYLPRLATDDYEFGTTVSKYIVFQHPVAFV
jgi:hypothetical protein